MVLLYLLFLGAFGWIIYAQPREWWKVIGTLPVFTLFYFWSVRVECARMRDIGAFAAEEPKKPLREKNLS